MAGRTRAVEMRPAAGNGPSGFIREVPDYAPRDEDRAWVERELGDVEPVPLEGRPKYDIRDAIAQAAQAAAIDAMLYGTGVVKVMADGTVLPVPADELWERLE